MFKGSSLYGKALIVSLLLFGVCTLAFVVTAGIQLSLEAEVTVNYIFVFGVLQVFLAMGPGFYGVSPFKKN